MSRGGIEPQEPRVDLAPQPRWIPPNSPYPHTYVIPQLGLEELLLTRLAEFGIAPERGAEITGISMDDSSVTAQTDHGEDLTSEWLIGADGARSRVRSCIGIDFSQRVTGETYWLADAHIELPVDIGDSALWLDRNGPFMLMRLPGPDHLWRIFADVSDHGLDADFPTRDSLSALMGARGPVGAHIHSVEWTSVFRTRIGLAERYLAGRAFFAGDAAHTFPPFGGQGMNLGIQDAMNLAWRLAGRIRGAPAEILEGYEAERRPVAAATIRDVDARRRLYSLRNPIARAGRDLLLRAGGALAAAERRTSLQNSQLTTTYRAVADGGAEALSRAPGIAHPTSHSRTPRCTRCWVPAISQCSISTPMRSRRQSRIGTVSAPSMRPRLTTTLSAQPLASRRATTDRCSSTRTATSAVAGPSVSDSTHSPTGSWATAHDRIAERSGIPVD